MKFAGQVYRYALGGNTPHASVSLAAPDGSVGYLAGFDNGSAAWEAFS